MRLISLLFISFIFSANSASSEQDPLQEIAFSIEAETENLNLLQAERKSLEASVKNLETKRARTNKTLSLKKEELAGVEARTNELAAAIESLEQKHKNLNLRFKHAFRSVLSNSQESLTINALIAKTNRSLIELNYFLQKAQFAYTNLTTQVVASTQKLNSTKLDLKALSDEKTSVIASLENTLQEQKNLIEQEKGKFAELQSKVSAVKKALNSLKAQRLRLAAALKGLGGANDEARASLDVARTSKTSNETSLKVDSLTLPVEGKVTRKFQSTGPYKKTGVAPSSRGTELTAEPGSKVTSIASGTVVFAGKLPGYDQVIILDHGERTYSLYGALGDLLVKKGDSVKAKTEIALVAERGGIYFETREKRDSVDPKKFFGAEKGF